jgi:hypothetical protein
MSDTEEMTMKSVKRLQEIDGNVQKLIKGLQSTGNIKLLEPFIRGYIKEIESDHIMTSYINYELSIGSVHYAMLQIALYRDLCTILDEKEKIDEIFQESKKAYNLIGDISRLIERINEENPGTISDEKTRPITDLFKMFSLRITDYYCRKSEFMQAVPYAKSLWISQALEQKNEKQVEKLKNWTDREWMDSLVKANEQRNKELPTEQKQIKFQYPSYKSVNVSTPKLASCGDPTCTNTESKVGQFKQCSRCKRMVYCSANCQQKHWSVHKQICKPT